VRIQRLARGFLARKNYRRNINQDRATAREIIDELARENIDLASQIQKKDAEIKSITQILERETVAKLHGEKQLRDLQGQLGNLSNKLDKERVEWEMCNKQRKRLEEEIEKLADMLSRNCNEGDKQNQVLTMRDTELNSIRNLLASIQEELGESHKNGQQLLEKAHGELDDAIQETSYVTRAKQSCSDEARSNIKIVAESESVAARSRIEEIENSLREDQISKCALEQSFPDVTGKFDEGEINRERLEELGTDLLVEKVNGLKDEVEEETRKPPAIESHKKRIYDEVSARLEEDAKSENSSNLIATKSRIDIDAGSSISDTISDPKLDKQRVSKLSLKRFFQTSVTPVLSALQSEQREHSLLAEERFRKFYQRTYTSLSTVGPEYTNEKRDRLHSYSYTHTIYVYKRSGNQTIKTCGSNKQGQCGSSFFPMKDQMRERTVHRVSTTEFCSWVLFTDGSLFAFGSLKV
jgi:chromosome segregation ATPase